MRGIGAEIRAYSAVHYDITNTQTEKKVHRHKIGQKKPGGNRKEKKRKGKGSPAKESEDEEGVVEAGDMQG